MAPLRKPALFRIFENSLRKCGLNFLRLSAEGAHPASYQVIGPANSFTVQVYIWNLTFGGRQSIPGEWRIQVTGLPEFGGHQRFQPKEGEKTVVLGWCQELQVFAGYDVTKHLGPLGGSPSIQIRQPALEACRVNGLAHHFRGGEEVAFAIKPECMGIYLDFVEDLHACGSSNEALELLAGIFEDPPLIDDSEVNEKVPEPRRFAVVSTKKALRDANFSNRVLTAYSNTCAMCGTQLRLLDAAHILPAAHPESTDDTSNGISLCALHHRAYDRGLVTFGTNYRIHINASAVEELTDRNLHGGLEKFSENLFHMIEVPPAKADRPAEKYVEQVNSLRGWVI
ncbi:HNH endonuclease [Leisingera sp. ANG-M7]|uniref:HNH endonuclease n=1 Tax=Leisingera sp. ANG-M7 TaxID=1577902 RepID=UPI00057EA7F0|nr:HNH endonuclease [Leisingera sp. ANG-M7]KIC39400.1 hypothetical protein RA26_01770 [Leisingera sp. ANG-M7]